MINFQLISNNMEAAGSKMDAPSRYNNSKL